MITLINVGINVCQPRNVRIGTKVNLNPKSWRDFPKYYRPVINSIKPGLRKNWLPFALIGGILSIVQPSLFDMGVQTLKEWGSDPNLSNNPERLREVLGYWHSPFSGISVISNRVTNYTVILVDRQSGWIFISIGGVQEWPIQCPWIRVHLYI